MKSLFVTFLLVFALLLTNTFIEPTMAAGSVSFCGSKCSARCSKAGEQKRCLKYCNICCGICKCVPPGTYGNKESCACYANLKNSKGTSKCP